MSDETTTPDVLCPFCGEGGFDLIGLKRHLQVYCEKFDEAEEIHSPFDMLP